jgi:hypothetical protein
VTEEERADWLAEAIDDLVRGNPVSPPPQGLDSAEVEALLRVSRVRLDAARESANVALAHEATVWQEVLERLEILRQADEARRPLDTADDALFDLHDEVEEGLQEDDDLGDVVALRRRMARDIAALAETHRDSVWRELQSRITRPHHSQEKEPLVKSGEDRRTISFRVSALPLRLRLTALAAGLALVLAVGPLPATGLAHHPFVEAGRAIGSFVGLTETASTPPVTGDPQVVSGSDVSAAEAAAISGLPLHDLHLPPEGFVHVSSRFFSVPFTADHPGLFVQTFEGEDGSAFLTVYQEAAAGADLAAGVGSAASVILPIGSEGTYFEGNWQVIGGELHWTEGPVQTLVYDHDGVRTIIRYSGPPLSPAVLLDIPGSMTPVE